MKSTQEEHGSFQKNLEGDRQKALSYYRILDSEHEERFDEVVRLTCRVVGTPIGYISFLDIDREWFKAVTGFDITQTDRYRAFSQYSIKEGTSSEINDLREDPWFKEHPLISGPPYLRAYLGAPILDHEGNALGSICAVDTVPRNFDEKDHLLLQHQAEHIIALLDARLEELNKHKVQQELSLRILETEEETRQQVGQDIHDGIAQTLSASSMFFERLKMELQEEEKQRLSSYIEDIESSLTQVMEETRGVSHDLTLKDLQFGLVEALQNLLAPFDGSNGETFVDFKNELGDLELSEVQKKNLYRIVQEILNNTWKHSDGHHLKIHLSGDPDQVQLHTEDDGTGSDESERIQGNGSIKDRVHALGGSIDITDRKTGVSLDIRIPLKEKQIGAEQ